MESQLISSDEAWKTSIYVAWANDRAGAEAAIKEQEEHLRSERKEPMPDLPKTENAPGN